MTPVCTWTPYKIRAGVGSESYMTCKEVPGELTMEQAAAVTTIGNVTSGTTTTVFTNNTKIQTFKELVHFKNLTGMGRGFVMGCSNLKEIHIPASVTRIGDVAFYNATKLAKIYFYPKTAPSLGSNCFGNSANQSPGYVTRNAGTNECHVPVDATGYDIGPYKNRLQSVTYSGFRMIYDL